MSRHDVRIDRVVPEAPLSVGNGELAFAVDVTGLQTLPDSYPVNGPFAEPAGSLLGTQSSWGWHSSPVHPTPSLEDARRRYDSPHGPVDYVDLSGRTAVDRPERGSPGELWLRNNPHRLNLVRIGLDPECLDQTSIEAADVTAIDQRLDLWTGTIISRFRVGVHTFEVATQVHPHEDVIAITILSSVAAPAVRLEFPYGRESWANASDWTRPTEHQTRLEGLVVNRTLDGETHQLRLAGAERVEQVAPHRIVAAGTDHRLHLAVAFAPTAVPVSPTAQEVDEACRRHWSAFWSTGGALDLSESSDERAIELERRSVLSLYQTAINCSGSLPPQETGLMVNSWRGRFHLEMHWWHSAHFPIWGRPELLERSLDWYSTILPVARATARRQKLAGARWPKQVGPDGRESPSDIGPFLIWQQPHPIHLAELVYRAAPRREVLDRYADVVFSSAEFMASYAYFADGAFHLGPPLVPAQESDYGMREQISDPTFELSYWSFGLRVANLWRERLGVGPNPRWHEVASRMASPPVVKGRYAVVATPPSVTRHDHPSMLAALGMLPQSSAVDPVVMESTLIDVLADWDWLSTWGWDFPMMAMTAARLGRSDLAVASLLHPAEKNQYLVTGHNRQTEALPTYLPANGGLLSALALLAVGTDDEAPTGLGPGFSLTAEGIHPAMGTLR